ncbi:hypothetical protein [Spirosoma sp.]|uniref:hypothetical protein n=1 Tax=Spirosoma sp. TaxID=1899569 RepID=UPI003B3BA9BD
MRQFYIGRSAFTRHADISLSADSQYYNSVIWMRIDPAVNRYKFVRPLPKRLPVSVSLFSTFTDKPAYVTLR